MTKWYIIALIWGIVWASFLQFHHLGRFLALKRTWLTVVIGIGIDLLIALRLIPFVYWQRVLTVIALSSIGIIFRSLANELAEVDEELNGYKNPYS